jgi:hypothetical protein
MHLEVRNTGPIVQDALYISYFGPFPTAVKFAFSDQPVGTISEVLNYDNGITVLCLKEIKKEFYRPLDEVKEQIKNILTGEKRTEKLQKIGNEAFALVRQDGRLESFVDKYPDTKVDVYTAQSVNVPLKNVPKSSAVTGALLALKPVRYPNRLWLLNIPSSSSK